MNKIFLLRSFSLCFYIILINSIDLSAQEMLQKKSALYWANIGLGASSNDSFVGDIGFNIQNGNMLYSLQISEIDSLTGIIGTPKMEKSFIVIGALLGVATRDTDWHASLSGGVTYVSRTITTNLFAHKGDPFDFFPAKAGEVKDVASVVGFTLEAQLFWKIGKVMGIGMKLFINANKLETIKGLIVNVILGKLY